MTHYVRVCPLAGIPGDRGRPVFVDGKVLVVFLVGDEVYALDDSCPHNGSSLAAGKLEGAFVQCRAHGLRFDVRTGRMRGIDGFCAKSYPARVVGGTVEVDIEKLRSTATDGVAAVDAGASAPCLTNQAATG
jgi:3-phenylpropionate/trans-cinnamate dioxygenase ferredoxin subunit